MKHKQPDIVFAPSRSADETRMVGCNHQQHLFFRVDQISDPCPAASPPKGICGSGKRFQAILRCAAFKVADIDKTCYGKDRHTIGFRRKPFFHMIRLPWVFSFILPRAEAVFIGRTDGVHVANPGITMADIHHNQADGPPDGRVYPGKFTRSQGAHAVVDSQFIPNRAIDH